MAYKCDICSKKTAHGETHSHHAGVAGGQWKKRAQHTKRSYAPNLHYITLPVNGVMTRMKACTSCISRIKFNNAKRKASENKKITNNHEPPTTNK